MKIKYKNNLYKFKNNTWYIYGGENNLYISKITDNSMIEILTNVLKEQE